MSDSSSSSEDDSNSSDSDSDTSSGSTTDSISDEAEERLKINRRHHRGTSHHEEKASRKSHKTRKKYTSESEQDSVDERSDSSDENTTNRLHSKRDERISSADREKYSFKSDRSYHRNEDELRERIRQRYMEREPDKSNNARNTKKSSDRILREESKQSYGEKYKHRHSDEVNVNNHKRLNRDSRHSDERLNQGHRSADDRLSKEHRKRKNESRQSDHPIPKETYHKRNNEENERGYRRRDNREERGGRDKNHTTNNRRDREANNRSNEREWDAGKFGENHGSSNHGFEVKNEERVSPKDAAPKKEEADFKLSGKLTEYTNTYNGVVIMYNEPPEARKPKTKWRFYPFKGEKALTMLQLHRQSAFLLGRDRKVADIPVDHPSCSKQHAVLQFRLVPYEKDDGSTGKRVKPYVIDLDSRNGTFVNNKRIDGRRYVELAERDVIKFGFSSRDYVLLHEKSQDVFSEDEGENEDIKLENVKTKVIKTEV